MSGFKALNVDSESEEDEIDNTKEMQMEDAFRIYQNALKLHSQGPSSYGEAARAYDALFKSEVFKYPEAVSEFAHDQMDDDGASGAAHPESGPVAILSSTAADSSATSIPQIIYLSHKNRGEFTLEKAHSDRPSALDEPRQRRRFYEQACQSALKDFAESLERDDTDIDLWKKAARVAEVLQSERIARFCYESALAGDDDGSEQVIDLSGLDEAFSAGELDKIQHLLQDDLSLARSGSLKPRESLLTLLSKSADPYPFLPKRTEASEYLIDSARPPPFSVGRIKLTSSTLPALGQEILTLVLGHQEGEPTISAHHIISPPQSGLRRSPSEMDTDVFVDADETVNMRQESLKEDENQDTRTPEVKVDQPFEDTARRADETKSGEHSDKAPTTTDQPSHTEGLPTRKRSSTAAGNDEPEARARSKRLRARESMADVAAPEEEPVPENTAHQSWNWTVLQTADADAFKVLNTFLSKLGLDPFDSVSKIRATMEPECNPGQLPTPKSISHSDLGKALRSWSDDHSHALINGHGQQDFVERSAGLALFMQHTKPLADVDPVPSAASEEDDFVNFVTSMDGPPKTLYDSAYLWLQTVLTSTDDDRPSPYMRNVWTENLKQTVVQLLVSLDEHLLNTLTQSYLAWSHYFCNPSDHGDLPGTRELYFHASVEFVQTIFELHIDLIVRITSPSSQEQPEERVKQAERLERWAGLADDYMRLYTQALDEAEVSKSLMLRFLWAATLYAGKGEDVNQTHIIRCLQDLKLIVADPSFNRISLPNNAAMPQLSAAAAEQEISRLSTLDFFMSVFDNDSDNSIAVIEKLEPILELDLQLASRGTLSGRVLTPDAENLVQFLNSGDASLKLFLWRRLQNAYVNINYSPRVVSCLLRSLEIIAHELMNPRHAQLDEPSRQTTMLKWLKDADDLIQRVLSKIVTDNTAFDFVDADHLLSSISSTLHLLRLAHAYALNEDDVRFGNASAPQFPSASSARLWEKSKDRFREMNVHLWTLLYYLLKDAVNQFSEHFPDPANDLADYLCCVHHALGQRHYCRFANKQFVKLVKTELNSLETTNDYYDDVAQVCYDLYDLKFKVRQGDFDHGCPSESLDKKTAVSLIPTIMAFANRMDMKDLIKGDLKITIDRVQAATGQTKAGKVVAHNKKLLLAYLRSPVLPEELYKAMKGIGDLPSRPINDDSSVKAKSGWFFLLGHMTLAKYRSVKRVSPTPTDDLENASQFLQQDLHYDMEKWETWYRLAQVFEARIEDDLIWNSTKLNDARDDIALLERSSIHCFTMAIAVAMRSADDNVGTAQKIEDLYREFAIRLYASSREPLNMDAFRTDKQLRQANSLWDLAASKQRYHQPLRRYQLWNFAAYLLKRKLTDKPKPWISHYTLAKCLWKMFKSPENDQSSHRITISDILTVSVHAIEALPRKDGRSDPVLEPHIKLVSLVHKLVINKTLSPQQGYDWLQASTYSRNIPLIKDEDEPDWEEYILVILKKLAQADKSNWHHRIVARRAHVIYDETRDINVALGAKHELMQQIFTKTMTYNVWKPDSERPGRHYVYTGRYVLFFAKLLDQLNDRPNFDQLVRKIRRKQADFIDHTKIWETLTTMYVLLLRRVGKIPEGKERAVFDHVPHEEFTKISEGLEKWAMEPDTSSTILEIVRDSVELKKLNNSLAKGSYIDDLIGDSYASLYENYVSQLPKDDKPASLTHQIPQGTFINMISQDQPPVNGLQQPIPTGDVVGSNAQAGLGIQTPTHHFVGHSQAPTVVPSGSTERPKPGRVKIITKREIQRKADAMLVRPQPIKTPVLNGDTGRQEVDADEMEVDEDADSPEIPDSQAKIMGLEIMPDRSIRLRVSGPVVTPPWRQTTPNLDEQFLPTLQNVTFDRSQKYGFCVHYFDNNKIRYTLSERSNLFINGYKRMKACKIFVADIRCSRWSQKDDYSLGFYYSQLLHRGLPTTADEEVAKWRLYEEALRVVKGSGNGQKQRLDAVHNIKLELHTILEDALATLQELPKDFGGEAQHKWWNSGRGNEPEEWMVEEQQPNSIEPGEWYGLVLKAWLSVRYPLKKAEEGRSKKFFQPASDTLTTVEDWTGTPLDDDLKRGEQRTSQDKFTSKGES
ncbi:hypothetical protein DV737_g3978, partial [Chaetothyriales sp. CBS 132003]